MFITYVAVDSASTQNVLGNFACASILRTLSMMVRFILSASPFSSGVFVRYGKFEPDSLRAAVPFKLPLVFSFVISSNRLQLPVGFSFHSCVELLEDR